MHCSLKRRLRGSDCNNNYIPYMPLMQFILNQPLSSEEKALQHKVWVWLGTLNGMSGGLVYSHFTL